MKKILTGKMNTEVEKYMVKCLGQSITL